MFSDAFNKDHQLIRAEPRRCLYLATALLVRGNVQLSDLRRNILRSGRPLSPPSPPQAPSSRTPASACLSFTSPYSPSSHHACLPCLPLPRSTLPPPSLPPCPSAPPSSPPLPHHIPLPQHQSSPINSPTAPFSLHTPSALPPFSLPQFLIHPQ